MFKGVLPFFKLKWSVSGRWAINPESSFSSESWAESEANIPIFYPVPFKEISNITTYPLEEQREEYAQLLKHSPQRHFFMSRAGEETIAAVTPYVKPFKIFPRREEEYVLEHFIKPYGKAVSDIDSLLQQRRENLTQLLEGEPEPYDPDVPVEDFDDK